MRLNNLFLWKPNLRRGFKTSFRVKNNGFTLVELLVVFSMIAIMVSFLILFIDPFKQLEKAKDGQRQQSLKQIQNALDAYYNDKGCFPTIPGFSNGTWQSSAVYIKQVPQDPDCAGGGSCYSYVTDTAATCPQWNVLFAKIYNKSNLSSTCALEQLSNCLPSNYATSGYNFCILSGKVDCAFISSLSLPANAGSGTGVSSGFDLTAGGSSGGGGQPCNKNYSCTGTPARCNVIFPAGSGQYCASNCNGNCP